MKLIFLVLFFLFSFTLSAIAARDGSEKKIQPLAAQTVNPVVEAKNERGKVIYDQFCIVCHQDGVLGAPQIGVEKDWKPRLSGRKVDDLLGSVIKGLNAMPAKGTCYECSDDELQAAIQFMLPKS